MAYDPSLFGGLFGGLSQGQAGQNLQGQSLNQALAQQQGLAQYWGQREQAFADEKRLQEERIQRQRAVHEIEKRIALEIEPAKNGLEAIKIVPRSFRDELRNEIEGWLPRLKTA